MEKKEAIIDDALIEKLAELSLLEFDAEKKQKIKTELNNLVAFYDKISTFPLNEFEQKETCLYGELKGRDDVAEKVFSKKEALKNAVMKNEDFFIVPKIISKD